LINGITTIFLWLKKGEHWNLIKGDSKRKRVLYITNSTTRKTKEKPQMTESHGNRLCFD